MHGVTFIHDFTPLPTKDHVAANRIFRVRNAECGVRKQGKRSRRSQLSPSAQGWADCSKTLVRMTQPLGREASWKLFREFPSPPVLKNETRRVEMASGSEFCKRQHSHSTLAMIWFAETNDTGQMIRFTCRLKSEMRRARGHQNLRSPCVQFFLSFPLDCI